MKNYPMEFLGCSRAWGSNPDDFDQMLKSEGATPEDAFAFED